MLKIEFKDKRADALWVVGKSFTIGSADDNNLVIDDPSVSPQHAKLTYQNGAYSIKDMGNSEGTLVNQKKVSSQIIGCHDIIRFGDVELVVVDPFESEDAAQGNLWSLIASSSWLTGQEFPIRPKGDKPVIIGRGKNCDIMFPGTHLSRQHVEILVKDGYIEIKDLESANGTFINDKRISTGRAQPGDSVRLDVYNFKVFGPGFNLRRSATASDIPAVSFEDYSETKEDAENTPQWNIPPTSPGNRIEPESRTNSAAMIAFSMVMLLGMIGAAYYLLFL